MYVRDSVTYTGICDLEISDLEMISVEIRNPNSRPLLATTWYRPPKAQDECFEKFERYLQSADSKYWVI